METQIQPGTEAAQQACWSEQVGQAYTQYREPLLRYIQFWIGGSQPETAEDLLADTFVRVLCHGQKRELPKGIEKPWLYRIARNLCIDYLRRCQRTSARVVQHLIYKGDQTLASPIEAAAALVPDPDGTHDPERMLLAREALADTIEQIAPGNRSAVILRALGLPVEEIEELLQLSKSATKMRISRGYKLVRQQASLGA